MWAWLTVFQALASIFFPWSHSSMQSSGPNYLSHRFLFTILLETLIPWSIWLQSCFSCVWFLATPWTVVYQAPLPMDSPDKNTGVGCHSLLQEILPTQGWNPSLLCFLHCKHILYRWATGAAFVSSLWFLGSYFSETQFSPRVQCICCSKINLPTGHMWL